MNCATSKQKIFNPASTKNYLGVESIKSQKSLLNIWNISEDGRWMLWIATKLEVDVRKLTLAKALCVKTMKNLKKSEKSLQSLEVAIKFGNNKASFEEIEKAKEEAVIAVNLAKDTSYYVEAYAVYVTTYAVYEPFNNSNNSAYSTYISFREINQTKSANICRKILTDLVIEKYNNLVGLH